MTIAAAGTVQNLTTEWFAEGNNESLGRTRVEGGWIYHARVWDLAHSGLSNSMAFVPDPGSGGAPPGSGTSEGVPEAPEDGAAYGRMDADWTPVLTAAEASGYVTHEALETALEPYAFMDDVPVASDELPAVDGPGSPGMASFWARGDHVHPTDTSRYDASNPAGYQTADDVTTALEPYALGADVTTEIAAAVAAPRMGVTDGSDAGPGEIGEYISVDNVTGLAMAANTPLAVCTIVLPAGCWEIWGACDFTVLSVDDPAPVDDPATRAGVPIQPNQIGSSISIYPDALPTENDLILGIGVMCLIFSPLAAGQRQVLITGQCRSNSTAPITLYLVAQIGLGNVNVKGYVSARRVR